MYYSKSTADVKLVQVGHITYPLI